MFSCCWTPVIRSSSSTILFKFGSKAPLKEPSNLSLSLRKGLRRFRSCKRGLDSFELTSRYFRTLIRASSVQQQPDTELLGSLFAMRRFWRRKRGFCLTTVQCLIRVIVRESYIVTWTVVHWKWWSRRVACSSKEVRSHETVIFFFFFKFSCINIFFLGKIVWNHPPHFNIAFIGKPVSTYVVLTKVAGLVTNNDVTLGDYSNTCYLFRKYLQTLNSSLQSRKLQMQTQFMYPRFCLAFYRIMS